MGRILTPTGASGVLEESARVEILNPFPNDATKFLDGTGAFTAPTSTGTVTNTGTLTSGKLIQGNGGVDVTVNATTATVTKLTSGTPSAASAGTDYVAPGAVTTSGLTQATAKLLGRTTASTGAIEEITVGANLTFSAGTLSASASGGNVTTSATLTSGKTIIGNGSVDINVSSLTATVVKSSSGTLAAATDGTDYLSPATGLTLIEQKTPTTGNSVTFSSLGSFTHLQIVWTGRSDVSATSASINVQFNADTGNNYDSEDVFASASSAAGSESLAAGSTQVGSVVGATGTASVAGSGTIYIYDYRGTTFHKTLYALNVLPRLLTTTNIFSQGFAGRWRNTAAITSITILLGSSSNFVTGSKLTLYGMP